MKAILMSIRPENLINILNGNKTLEQRKTVPTNFVGWVYLYCVKAKPYLGYGNYFTNSQNWETGLTIGDNENGFDTIMNGKIVARFWFDEYDVLTSYLDEDGWVDNSMLNKLCLEQDDIDNYAKENYEKLFAWRIKNLEIFDKPMELSEFAVFDGWNYYQLEKPSPNWQYVWVKGEMK